MNTTIFGIMYFLWGGYCVVVGVLLSRVLVWLKEDEVELTTADRLSISLMICSWIISLPVLYAVVAIKQNRYMKEFEDIVDETQKEIDKTKEKKNDNNK